MSGTCRFDRSYVPNAVILGALKPGYLLLCIFFCVCVFFVVVPVVFVFSEEVTMLCNEVPRWFQANRQRGG